MTKTMSRASPTRTLIGPHTLFTTKGGKFTFTCKNITWLAIINHFKHIFKQLKTKQLSKTTDK